MAASAAARQLEWAAGALDAYLSTVARIAVGTPATRRGERRFPVPGTGHVINYRVTRGSIRVQLWYRARRHMLKR